MVMKMKQKKCRGLLFLLLASLMLTGCGIQEAPYELTEEEQQLIVSYSAHVVSKFNRYQKDGLTYVPDVEETEEVEVIPETEQPEVDTEIVSNENSEGTVSTEMEETAEEATLNSVFADMGLTFTYQGNEVTDSYMEDASYAVNAGYGKKLLVLKVQVENQTEEAITIDNLTAGDTYSAKYVMESGKAYNAKSVMTLLINDFTTFEGTIEPQTVVDMVIVFEIPDETTEVKDLTLKINRSGNIFQINL